MTWTTDNRFGGVSQVEVPENATAVYGARWIDMGDSMAADIVPDRQGFAYSDRRDVDHLIEHLDAHDARTLHRGIDYDVVACPVDEAGFKLYMRRAGGYVYVTAWLTP